jgi:hypothetical protein
MDNEKGTKQGNSVCARSVSNILNKPVGTHEYPLLELLQKTQKNKLG